MYKLYINAIVLLILIIVIIYYCLNIRILYPKFIIEILYEPYGKILIYLLIYLISFYNELMAFLLLFIVINIHIDILRVHNIKN